MGFPRKYLNDDEEIVLDLRPHWWFLIGPALALFLTLSGAIVIAVLVDGDARTWGLIPVLVLAVVSLLWFVARYAKWVTTNFVVTTDRLIHRSGVFAKSGR